MKVLVTGCNGQVGTCLVQQLSKKTEVELFAFDVQDLDITNQEEVAAKINQINPQVIINAAAYTAVDKAETDIENSYAINEKGALYLAQAANKNNALLLHISTDYVFDGSEQEPYTESVKPNPQSIYGKSKLAGERAVAENCEKYAILRTSWVFGNYGNNFVKTMLKLGKDRSELGIIGDQIGAPTYAGDIAKALITIATKFSNKEQSGIYNFSGYPYVSWYQFAQHIFNAAKQNKVLENIPQINEITTDQYPLPAPRPANSKLDCRKIKTEFNINPSDWQTALNNIKAYL